MSALSHALPLIAIAWSAQALAQDNAPGSAEDDPDDSNRSVAAETRVIPDWRVVTYTAPVTSIEILCAKQVEGPNDCLTIHLAASAQAGAMFQFNRDPDWFGDLHIGGEFRYGLLSGGYGLEGFLGTAWGGARKYYRATFGPELHGNLYEGFDYMLRPGFGLGWRASVAVKPVEQFWIHASAEPITQFIGPRKGTNLVSSVIDELEYRFGVQYTGVTNIGAGYVYRRNAGGLQHGFFIRGTF